MEITRREFLVLAATTAPLAVSLPSLVLAEEKKPEPAPPARVTWDELPLRGSAGECSGWHLT